MHDKTFDSPAYVADGPSVIREIADVVDAIAFLEEWPLDMQDLAHETVMLACHRAHDGHIPASAAHKAFAAFAEKAGILEDNVPVVEPWMIGRKGGNGGIPI